jgi:hypothetical protein
LLNTLEHIFFQNQLGTKKLKSNGPEPEREQQEEHHQQQTCAICGRPIKTNNIIIKQKIGTEYYLFDREECATILKKLHSVYGNDFCMMLKKNNTT